MTKKFWTKCIKRFFMITLPILGTFISIFTYFSLTFETALKTLGLLGAIIVCLLCFLITLVYGINEMTKVVDIVDKTISNTNSNDRIIYNYYNRYNVEKKNYKKNNSKIPKNSSLYNYVQKEHFTNKFIKMVDIYNDALQEICFEVMATGVTSVYTLINLPEKQYGTYKGNTPIKAIPMSLFNVNIKVFRENIDSNYVNNVLINYTANHLHGSFLICLYEEFTTIMYEQVQNDFIDYIKRDDYNFFVSSFIYELGSLFAGSSLTSLSSWSMTPSEIKNIKLDVNIDKSNFGITTENVYVTKLLCTNNEHKLFDSYIILDEIQAHNLLKKSFENRESQIKVVFGKPNSHA